VGPDVKPPPFDYYDPTTLPDVIELLATKENAKLLAGGQSLMPMLNMRFVRPDTIIDLNRLPELTGIHDEGVTIRIGSMTSQRDLEFSALVQRRCPLMHEALKNVGHRQTRNRGTIGGSLCHLDPAAELPSVALAYDAVIEVKNRDGAREIRMADFPAYYMTPAIQPDELVTGLRFPYWSEAHGSAFLEFARRQGDFAIVSVAVLLELASDRTIRRASITVGGALYAPQRLPGAEEILLGTQASEETLHLVADTCGDIDATGDVHASADYRRHLAATLSFRAVRQAYSRAIKARHQ
jgi:carbon-monoxide dehydrogenase medium subunit